MKVFLPLLLFACALSIGSTYASCKTKVTVYYPTSTYQVADTCSCHGTWGTPTCNCPNTPDTFIQTSGCGSCAVTESSERHWVPGHMHETEYEVYFDGPSIYPSPYQYNEDWAYTVP